VSGLVSLLWWVLVWIPLIVVVLGLGWYLYQSWKPIST
jgi:hypothetical protein